jgi:hypothetical protein
MLAGSRSKTRSTFGVAIGLLAVVMACAVPMSSSSASDFAAPRAASPAGALVAQDDSAVLTWGRDGGISVPLPNGRTFWVFADTPQWKFAKGTWRLTGFIRGSTAGMQDYKSGAKPTGKFLEVVLGKKLTKNNKASPFLTNPKLRMANGSGKPCNKIYAGSSAESVRWATGAALMPDKSNVFIPYVDVCVSTAVKYTVQGWGFALYNWKTNKLSVPPTDVFKPKASGADIPTTRWYGSPVIVGKTVTMFTSTCCGFPPGRVYTTTIAANVNALRNANSYVSTPIPNLPTNLLVNVSGKSKTLPLYTMYQSSDLKGRYLILSATSPTGPWSGRALGQLPKCQTSPFPCTSFAIHPQFSTAHKLIVSYYLPGSGPNVAGHPFTQRPNFGHIVWASIPI